MSAGDLVFHCDYKPSARQRVFHATLADECLYGGAAGGGKSAALVNDAIQHCVTYAGANAVLFRRTFPELNAPGGLIQEVVKWMPRGLARRVDKRWTFPNGSTLTLAHCQRELDVHSWQGAQFTWLGIDEAGNWPASMLLYLFSRVRTTLPGVRPVLRLGANPVGIGFAFLKARYVKPVLTKLVAADQAWRPAPKRDGVPSPSRVFIPARHSDNAYLDAGYIGRLLELPEAERNALLDGSWELPRHEGQMFAPEYIELAHSLAHGFAAPVDGARYLKLWDLANSADWLVNITLRTDIAPAQVVRFDRYHKRGWPENAADIERVHAEYEGETVIDATGAGDVLLGFLSCPVTPVVWGGKNKSEYLRRLQILFERGAIAGPEIGIGHTRHDDNNGIEHLWDELVQYTRDDKKLTQDCVMTLALGAMRIEMPKREVAVARLSLAGRNDLAARVDAALAQQHEQHKKPQNDTLVENASELRSLFTLRR